jgi:kynurenine formamidase
VTRSHWRRRPEWTSGADQVPAAGGRRAVPPGYEDVDPRTAVRVPLTMSLRPRVPLWPGDPAYTVDEGFHDSRTAAHDDGGYLVEHVTSMGTHSSSAVSAPAHFVLGGARLDQLGEDLALMPLVVVDVRERIRRAGPDFTVTARDLQAWERQHGQVPPGGCVLLLTGSASRYDQGEGEASPYVTTPVPGLAGDAVDWLFTSRRVLATGADALGPDATADSTLRASTATLLHGGVVLENVGPQLHRMRPHGDWLGVNGNRPALSGFPMGFTGYTLGPG